MMASKELVDSLQLPPRLAVPVVLTSGYTPGYKPFRDSINLRYNGTDLTLQVDATEVVCRAKTSYCEFILTSETPEPRMLTWEQILGVVIQRVTIALWEYDLSERQTLLAEQGKHVTIN